MTQTYDDVTDGEVYRDNRTGWVGRLLKPELQRVPLSPKDGRPKLPLKGASGKDDQVDEIRFAYIDDMEPVTGDPVGFGKVAG